MTIQQRIKRLNDLGVGYRLLGETLGVSKTALRYYALGDQQTIKAEAQQVLALVEALEKIFDIVEK